MNSTLPRVVLDTDTYNEVDDQFALAHLLLSQDILDLEAVYAAPFHNERSESPADGMEKSYDEIHRVLDKLPKVKKPPVFRGSTNYLGGAGRPVESAATNDLIERAMNGTEKLHVLAIAAITNIASALLLEPRIADKIVVVWLGGHSPEWPHTREFNLEQDLHGARVVLDRDVPLILLPCMPTTALLQTTIPDLEKFLEPHSKLGAYLTGIVRSYGKSRPGWNKVIWDIAASAWMINSSWVSTREMPSPVLNDDLTWQFPTPPNRRKIQIAYDVNREEIFADLYAKAKALGEAER